MYLPEPTATKTPVCFKIALDSDLLIPQSAFLIFPLEAFFDSPGGTRHRWAPWRQPMCREERWDRQMVQDEMSRRGETINARAKISSTSELISLTPTLRVWPKISFWHEDSGTTTAPSYRLSEAQTPPTSFWKQQLSSILSRKTNSTNSEHEMFRTQLVQLAIIRLQLCKYCLYLYNVLSVCLFLYESQTYYWRKKISFDISCITRKKKGSFCLASFCYSFK